MPETTPGDFADIRVDEIEADDRVPLRYRPWGRPVSLARHTHLEPVLERDGPRSVALTSVPPAATRQGASSGARTAGSVGPWRGHSKQADDQRDDDWREEKSIAVSSSAAPWRMGEWSSRQREQWRRWQACVGVVAAGCAPIEFRRAVFAVAFRLKSCCTRRAAGVTWFGPMLSTRND